MRARGFTLVEVMIALTILLVVVTGLAGTTARTVHSVAIRDRQAVAIELASHRLDEMRATPNYAGLETTFAGTESTIPGSPGFTRITQVVRVGGIG
ncbi:MAG: type IV pilus modification PilV family protein, partial [Gammaproteobacteria bacterium]